MIIAQSKEYEEYSMFTKPAELHKAVNILRGIVAGITTDSITHTEELQELSAMGRGARILDSVNGKILSNERRIAVRVGTSTCDGVHYDYHFM